MLFDHKGNLTDEAFECLSDALLKGFSSPEPVSLDDVTQLVKHEDGETMVKRVTSLCRKVVNAISEESVSPSVNETDTNWMTYIIENVIDKTALDTRGITDTTVTCDAYRDAVIDGSCKILTLGINAFKEIREGKYTTDRALTDCNSEKETIASYFRLAVVNNDSIVRVAERFIRLIREDMKSAKNEWYHIAESVSELKNYKDVRNIEGEEDYSRKCSIMKRVAVAVHTLSLRLCDNSNESVVGEFVKAYTRRLAEQFSWNFPLGLFKDEITVEFCDVAMDELFEVKLFQMLIMIAFAHKKA